MNPILTVFCCADAGCTMPGTANASAVAAATPILIIACIPLVAAPVGAEAFVY